ncbi:carboxypeptidase-like regulatory domain-containing protein [Deinococcus yavapaiensis]|uniref:Carboxypeptidase family protein n=1 Tax=Deinococcus yavapaiensis KR-236 TaxID=694435 RepID=A0A318S3X1_9DEIO|nr:carboxypeptidase-like regulatory domain-containing protein [Deinococcus yavapaiensis]PYE52760.1 carboxypeptidase family protein [Deinococcus yavapaiensis KR-236]
MSRNRLIRLLPATFASLALCAALTVEAATPNTVSGRVLDERGKPVVGAQIIVEPAMFRGTLFTKTDAQGRYQSIELNPTTNPYYVYAYKEINYHGRHYCVRMAGDPGEYQEAFNAKQGVVRNWRFKISGESDMASSSNGGQWWGGSLAFENVSTEDGKFIPFDSIVELRLTPDGPLIDGSVGKPIVKTVRLSAGIADIPVGYYQLSAFLVQGGAKTKLRVGTTNRDEKLGDTTMILFDGFDTCGHSGTFSTTHVWLGRP